MKALSICLLFTSNLLFAQNDTIKLPPKPTDDNTAKGIYENIDGVVATFPGGDTAFRSFLTKSIQKIADSALVTGIKTGTYRVDLNFMIDVEGNAKAITVESKPRQVFIENACKTMIEKSPKWTPSILSGRPVQTMKYQKLTIAVR